MNATPPAAIHTLSLHDALPISIVDPDHWSGGSTKPALSPGKPTPVARPKPKRLIQRDSRSLPSDGRSEEHTSELQSLTNLVCRLLLEKKKLCKVLYENTQRTSV